MLGILVEILEFPENVLFLKYYYYYFVFEGRYWGREDEGMEEGKDGARKERSRFFCCFTEINPTDSKSQV